MIDALLWIGAVLWIILTIQFLLNLVVIPSLSETEGDLSTEAPQVSIVVPARNEERAIGRAVASLCRQDYPSFEVVVVDDGSSDATPEILEGLRGEFSCLRVIKGVEPPAGWLGKPNALEIGRRAARGEWLLFVDADVIYRPETLRRAMAMVLSERADMIFLCPRMLTSGAIEAALMSSVFFLGFAVMPSFLTLRTKSPRLALGGGTGNLVRRDVVEAIGAFTCLRNEVIDDIGLARKVRAGGFRAAVTRAGGMVEVRMYEGVRETVEGFTKNLYWLFKQNPWLTPVPLVGGTILSLLPYWGFAAALEGGRISVPATISLFFMHVVFAGIARFFHMHWAITFLNPIRELGWWWILLRSTVRARSHGIVWRGRRTDLDL